MPNSEKIAVFFHDEDAKVRTSPCHAANLGVLDNVEHGFVQLAANGFVEVFGTIVADGGCPWTCHR